jgi:hypothetical protein
MTLTSDLFLSILSMDAYNRGYNRSVIVAGDQIGHATLDNTLEEKVEWQDAGFFAQAYTVTGGALAGKTVISYRGTDNFNPGSDPTSGASDWWSGWSIGAGFSAASQAGLAKQFYLDVTNQSFAYGTAAANVVLTGHSLGGGLAGYISSLNGTKAWGFDHMPFSLAAWVDVITQATIRSGTVPTSEADIVALGLRLPTAGEFDGIYTKNELLQHVRNGQVQSLLAAALSTLSVRAGTGTFIDGLATAGLEQSVAKTELDTFGWSDSTDIVALHSNSLLVALQYAKDKKHENWQSQDVSKHILDAFFDDRIGAKGDNMTSVIDPKTVTNWYLYGTDTTPLDKEDNSLIRKTVNLGLRPSRERHADAAERAVVGVHDIARGNVHRPREGAGEHDLAFSQAVVQGGEFVHEPSDAGSGMAHDASGKSGFLDHAVFRQRRADPSQIDIHRPHRPAAQNNGAVGRIIGDGVDDGAGHFRPVVDDFQRGRHVLGGAQYIVNAAASALQIFTHDKGEFGFQPRFYERSGRDPGPIIVEGIVENDAVVWLRHS